MRALRLHGPGDVRLEEVPDPHPAPGEVIIATEFAMTCATDAKIMRSGRHPAIGPCPTPIGHEVTGRVVEIGEGADVVDVGDAVVVANSAPCGECFWCGRDEFSLCDDLVYLWGAFAERVRVPARIAAVNMIPRPVDLDPRLAPMIEPLACAVHGADRSQASTGDTVVVLGGGVQGQLLTARLSQRGCAVVVCDPHPERRERALRFGATAVADAPRDAEGIGRVRDLTPGCRGADVVIEAIGRPETWRIAVQIARRGGEVVFYGGCPVGSDVSLPTEPLHYGALRITGTYHHTPAAVREALALLTCPPVPVAELVGPPVGLADVTDVLSRSGVKRPVDPAI